jgi:hypothetical protein
LEVGNEGKREAHPLKKRKKEKKKIIKFICIVNKRVGMGGCGC